MGRFCQTVVRLSFLRLDVASVKSGLVRQLSQWNLLRSNVHRLILPFEGFQRRTFRSRLVCPAIIIRAAGIDRQSKATSGLSLPSKSGEPSERLIYLLRLIKSD